MTHSELLAVNMLTNLGAHTSIVATEAAEGNQTPDFFVAVGDTQMVVEVKEITLNAADKESLRRAEAGEIRSSDRSQDFRRFASAIRSANKQLKTKCKGRPGLTLLLDLRGFLMRAIDPQHCIHRAMFGEEEVWFSQPSFTIDQPNRMVAHKFGGGRTLNQRSNTTTSAVGLMLPQESGQTVLWLHHNPFAAIPIPHGMFCSPLVTDFVVSSTNQFASFVAQHKV